MMVKPPRRVWHGGLAREGVLPHGMLEWGGCWCGCWWRWGWWLAGVKVTERENVKGRERERKRESEREKETKRGNGKK